LDKAAQQLYSNALTSGKVERAGPLLWFNEGTGTKKLGSYLGLPDDAMDKLVSNVADTSLKAAGFDKGIYGRDYQVVRMSTPEGKPTLYVLAYGKSGHTDVVITLDQLRAANRKQILTPKPKPTAYKSGGRVGGMVSVDAR